MIVKGGSRRNVSFWSRHLIDLEHNQGVDVSEAHIWNGNDAAAVHENLKHFQEMAKFTNGKKGLYCAHIDPDAVYAMSAAQWEECVNILERQLGFEGQPRLVVKHSKNGRDHIHVVWQRAKQKADGSFALISDSHNYKNHELAARAMEVALGHELVKGVFTGRDRDPKTDHCQDERPVAQINHSEWQQGVRLARDMAAVKAELMALWAAHDSGKDFKAALEQSGYQLAQGDKKPVYMVVDGENGEAYDLRRSLKGVKKANIEECLHEYPAQSLETVAMLRDRVRNRTRAREEQEQIRGDHLRREREARRIAFQTWMDTARLNRPKTVTAAPQSNKDKRLGASIGRPTKADINRRKRAHLKQAVKRMKSQWDIHRQAIDHDQSWTAKAEIAPVGDGIQQAMAGIEEIREGDEGYRLEQREEHIKKSRASLRLYGAYQNAIRRFIAPIVTVVPGFLTRKEANVKSLPPALHR